MAVAEGSPIELLHAISKAPRSLVFLSVPWSGPERLAREAFQIAAIRLSDEYIDLRVNLFLLDEEDEVVQTWLSSLGVPYLGSGYAQGAGSLLWMERGRVVMSEITASFLGASGIVEKSLSLWESRT
jgi:hypothetical protein